MLPSQRVLLLANAVAPLGHGTAGGTSMMIMMMAEALKKSGYSTTIWAPAGSSFGSQQFPVRLFDGALQPDMLQHPHDSYSIIADSVLARYFEALRAEQTNYDLVINCCTDWLPYYLAPFFKTPLFHMVTVANENDIVTSQLQKLAHTHPERIALMSHAQRHALALPETVRIVELGLDTAAYVYNKTPIAERDYLVWTARITPDKGLADAAEIAARAGFKLHVCGFVQDEAYFQTICTRYADTIDYRGFLDKPSLMGEMRGAKALLCTHQWIEAFGLVVIEALACGTPVITYRRGGPAEIISHGVDGFIVESIDEAVSYIAQLPSLDPLVCRMTVETRYDTSAYAKRLLSFINQ